MTGMWVVVGISTFWVALGSWVAVFPGTLESLLGVSYDFKGTWGVTRGTYELLTLSTLAVILAIALIGYWLARGVRAQEVIIPIQDDGSLPATSG
jgi:hypothetical protein